MEKLESERERDPACIAREARKNKREAQRVEAQKVEAEKKAAKRAAAESEAGPGPGCDREDTAESEEQAMVDLCNITGCSEDEVTAVIAMHIFSGRSMEEVWNLAYGTLVPEEPD